MLSVSKTRKITKETETGTDTERERARERERKRERETSGSDWLCADWDVKLHYSLTHLLLQRSYKTSPAVATKISIWCIKIDLNNMGLRSSVRVPSL